MASATITRCTDCGAPLVSLVEQWTGECTACGMPASLQVPYGAIWQASAGYSAEHEARCDANEDAHRERDDCEDADDTDSDPLPPSDWWQMDLATQDLVTKRQQT